MSVSSISIAWMQVVRLDTWRDTDSGIWSIGRCPCPLFLFRGDFHSGTALIAWGFSTIFWRPAPLAERYHRGQETSSALTIPFALFLIAFFEDPSIDCATSSNVAVLDEWHSGAQLSKSSLDCSACGDLLLGRSCSSASTRTVGIGVGSGSHLD